MTNRPDWMTVRPGGNADLLSEVLRGVRLTGALYYRVSTSCPWPPIRVPTGAAITGAFGGRTRNVISYHVVIEGTCWTGIEGDRPVQLRQGDTPGATPTSCPTTVSRCLRRPTRSNWSHCCRAA